MSNEFSENELKAMDIEQLTTIASDLIDEIANESTKLQKVNLERLEAQNKVNDKKREIDLKKENIANVPYTEDEQNVDQNQLVEFEEDLKLKIQSEDLLKKLIDVSKQRLELTEKIRREKQTEQEEAEEKIKREAEEKIKKEAEEKIKKEEAEMPVQPVIGEANVINLPNQDDLNEIIDTGALVPVIGPGASAREGDDSLTELTRQLENAKLELKRKKQEINKKLIDIYNKSLESTNLSSEEKIENKISITEIPEIKASIEKIANAIGNSYKPLVGGAGTALNLFTGSLNTLKSFLEDVLSTKDPNVKLTDEELISIYTQTEELEKNTSSLIDSVLDIKTNYPASDGYLIIYYSRNDNVYTINEYHNLSTANGDELYCNLFFHDWIVTKVGVINNEDDGIKLSKGDIFRKHKIINSGSVSIYILKKVKMVTHDNFIQYNNLEYVTSPYEYSSKYMATVSAYIGNVIDQINPIFFKSETLIIKRFLLMYGLCVENLKNDKIYKLLLTHIFEVMSRITFKVFKGVKLSNRDKAACYRFAKVIDGIIASYNVFNDSNVPSLEGGINALENPNIIKDILNKLEERVIKPKLISKVSSFLELNKIANVSGKVDVTRGYVLTDNSHIEMKEIAFIDNNIQSNIVSNGITNSFKTFKIIDRKFFKNDIPNLTLFIDVPIKNLFHIILCKDSENYPTMRRYARYNCGITKYGLIIGNIKYPENYIEGESDSSLTNKQFMDSLADCIELNKSCINKFNFALNNNSSKYISEKLYGEVNGDDLMMFDSNINQRYNINFGYKSEILGKSIFGINLEQVNKKFEEYVNIQKQGIKVFFEALPLKDNKLYEIITIAEYNDSLKINKDGFLN
jgi:hypothetical protein